MAQGKRPGGLTALAVLNFVFGGVGAIGALFALALISGGKAILDASGSKLEISTSVLYLALLLGVVTVCLEIAAGVGYLQQKRVLGRGVGNAYAIISLAGQLVNLLLTHQGFGILNIIGLVYPLLTLILLNTTFKDDLVN